MQAEVGGCALGWLGLRGSASRHHYAHVERLLVEWSFCPNCAFRAALGYIKDSKRHCLANPLLYRMNGSANKRLHYSASLSLSAQVTPELRVLDPTDQYVWLNQYAGQFIPIMGLLLLRSLLGFGSWVNSPPLWPVC
jgi:hypothetical protein